MRTFDESLVSKVVTFGSAVLLGALLTAAIGSLVLGALGYSLPHLCAGW
jgi:hypothetical protein